MKQYRNSLQITGSILEATKNKGRDGIQVTTLMTGANLPHPRLTKFLHNLCGTGLINKIKFDGKNTYVITEKGIQYLDHYQKFADIAESFGLEL